MLTPNAERAVVDIRKLRDYCLNPTHDQGKHKARLFAAALGMTSDDAMELRDVLSQVIKTHDAQLGRRDEYGQRYLVDFMLEWRGKRAMIRSGWIIEHGSDIPNLPERTRLFRLFKTHHDWTDRLLADPTVLGVADTYGIEL